MINRSITEVFKSIFVDKEWQKVTDDEKSSYFFLFNRYFSKRYPEKAQMLNDKQIDKIFAMNLLREFLKREEYPVWFWSKSEKLKEKQDFSEKDKDLLLSRFNLKQEELNLIIDFYPEIVKDELKYLKLTDK